MSGPTDTIRILHVDDDPDFTEMATTFLEREDERFSTETATTAGEALDRLADAEFDCIVSDYDMPGQNGIDFLETLREESPDLPFILFTGKGSEAVASEAISAGVTDYLQKDSGTSQYTVLANRVRNAVAARQSATEARRRRHRLEQILKTVPGCVVQLDDEGRFVFANDRAEDVLGLESDQVTDRAYNDPEWDIRDLSGEPLPDEELPFRRVRDSGEPVYGVKHTIRWPDGTRKVLLVNGAPLFDSDGAVDSVVFSLTDITDQQSQARELARTQRRLELALETTDTGVWEWDIETDDVVWNETLERAMGLEPGEFEGTFAAFVDRVHPEDLPRVREEVQRAIETDSVYTAEFRMRHEDGRYRWVDVSGRLVHDDEGERMVGVHHDITRHKEREQHLEAMERRLEAILENTTTPMFMKDAEGEYVFVNRRYRELFDLQDGEIVGRTDDEIHPSEVATEVQTNDHHVLERGEPVEVEERIVVDGDRRVFLTSKVPIYDTGERSDPEEPVAVFGVATDITERKEREQELTQYEEIIETIDDGVYVVDEDGEFVMVNDAYAGMLGYEREELLGADVSLVADEDVVQRAKQLEEKLRQGSVDTPTIEAELPTADGGRIPMEAKFTLLPGPDGGEYRVGVVRDVSERKAREQRLQRQNERLEEFASVVSHDLRNPLRLADGRLELARQDCDSEHLDSIDNALDRMDRIIEDVLSLAREGEAVGELERADLAAVAEDCWANVQTAAATLVTETDRSVYADPGRLKQVFENLVHNAVEHGGQDVTVTVGDLEDGFYVEDDGPGIPQEHRGDVFDAGYSTRDDGTGFGLSIVEEVVTAHGWEIAVTEGSVGGARFEITGVEPTTA